MKQSPTEKRLRLAAKMVKAYTNFETCIAAGHPNQDEIIADLQNLERRALYGIQHAITSDRAFGARRVSFESLRKVRI